MIRGYFDPESGDPRPLLRCKILLPGITSSWADFYPLIDTGAHTTSLHPVDAIVGAGISAERLADPGAWARHEQRVGVGGGARYFLTEAVYAFRHEDGQWQEISGDIRIAQLQADNILFPSLLGWDILRHFSISLDWRTRSITFS